MSDEQPAMKLSRLSIFRHHGGEMSGSLTIAGDPGEIAITLDDNACRVVVATCVDALIATATATAEQLRLAVLASVQTEPTP